MSPERSVARGHALVLGASSGLGAAIARHLAGAGHPILGVHFDLRSTQDRATAARAACEAEGVSAVFANGNATDARFRTEVLDGFVDREGPHAAVDVLVHSLAFGSLKPLASPTPRLRPRDLAMTLDVMAHSLVTWTVDLADRGLLRAGARVIALTSSGSRVALPAYGAVAAAKAALEAHVRQLAAELAPRGVAVNAIMPGLTDTPALRAIPGWEALAAEARHRNPHHRLTTPEDIGAAVVALTAPGLAWMTGQVVPVDGGETIAGAPFGPVPPAAG